MVIAFVVVEYIGNYAKHCRVSVVSDGAFLWCTIYTEHWRQVFTLHQCLEKGILIKILLFVYSLKACPDVDKHYLVSAYQWTTFSGS